ncbi:MAG: hypothetical protein KBG20_19040 [Caldilineaceae bacterium]|nr:hypothetical protein [Caldilineaceae bacterium]MBP8110462.1 hypothetical protein [Caldilineaceae bacterium]MBP8123450.1 hypothetical protein [Caldilineaceae bacterium]MBP9074411.1 hypothetical protein [Caldilineaceae bacterium]
MGPVEAVFFTIGILVTLIGLARGYDKELGNTVIILVAIFVLAFFDTPITRLLDVVVTRLPGLSGGSPEGKALIISGAYTLAFAAIVFASYAGRTLNMGARPAKPPVGTVYTFLIALLNGYLVSGTIWYYQDIFNYPLQRLGWVVLPLTKTAETLTNFLPQTLFPSPIYWMVPVAILLLIRVKG